MTEVRIRGRTRKDGLWLDRRTPGRKVWCFHYKGLDGRWHRERTQATSAEEARGLLRRKLSEIARARSLGLTALETVQSARFQDFAEEFLKQCHATTKPSTVRRYQVSLNRLLPFFGRRVLASITAGDVERYVVERRNSVKHRPRCRKTPCACPVIAPATVNRERCTLSKLMNMALRRGLVERNPVAAVRPLRENNCRERYLEYDEERRLLESAPEWLKQMIMIGLQTGMRLGEILEIRRGDVDRTRKLLRVPKTKSGQVRHVPLNDVALAVLDGVPPFVGSSFVFVSPVTGSTYPKTSVTHAFRRAAELSGLAVDGPDKVTFHTLRHTVVSRLVAAGMPDRKIMKMVGHSTSAMVSRYAHLSPEGLRDAAEALARRPDAVENRTRIVQTIESRKAAR